MSYDWAMNPKILHIDNHLLVVTKPADVLSQADGSKTENILDWGKDFIKTRYDKPGAVFLGLVHRLDKPVTGTMIFARTSKAASRLQEQFAERSVKKTYLGILEGRPSLPDKMIGYILKSPNRILYSKSPRDKYKKAETRCRLAAIEKKTSLVELKPITGRPHQLRLQMSSLKAPILGDSKYGSKNRFAKGQIALHCKSISIVHPTTKEKLTFVSEVDQEWNKHFDSSFFA